VYNYNLRIPRGYLSKKRLEPIRQLQMSPWLNELRDELLEWIQQVEEPSADNLHRPRRYGKNSKQETASYAGC